MERVTIDLVSDVVCPWCYLGKARLELAIAEVERMDVGDDRVDLVLEPASARRPFRSLQHRR